MTWRVIFLLRNADSRARLSDMKREIGLLRIEAKIEKLKAALRELGEMRPGSISRQYNVCGNPSCRCKDAKKPKKHGSVLPAKLCAQGTELQSVYWQGVRW